MPGRALLERALPLLRDADDEFRHANGIESLAGVIGNQGDYEQAKTLHEQGLAIGRRLNEPSTIAHALNGLAAQAFRRRDFARMAALAEEELALNRSVGIGVPESIHNLAEARRHLGQLALAGELYVEGLDLSIELGDVNGIAEYLDAFADLATADRNFVDAARLWAVSRRFFDEYGQVSWDPEEVERGLAAARSELGATRFDEAWRAGQELSRDEAVVLARTIAEQARTTAPAP